MLTEEQTILELHKQGHGTRAIKKALKISRGAIRQVIRLRSHNPPPYRPRRR